MIETSPKDSQSSAPKQWSHPPKKKWMQCYKAVEEERSEHLGERKSNVEFRSVIHNSGEAPQKIPAESAFFKRQHPHEPSPHLAAKLTLPNSGPQKYLQNAHQPPARMDNRSVLPLAQSPSYFDRASPRPSATSPAHSRARDERTNRRQVPYSPPPRTTVVTPANGSICHQASISPRTSSLSYCEISATSPSSNSTTSISSSESTSALGLVSNFRTASGFDATHTSYVARSVPVDVSLSRIGNSEPLQQQINGLTRPNGLSKSIPMSLGLSASEFEDALKDDPNKKRSVTTPSREVHNKLEKNRRAHLKECFEFLRKQLPSMDDKKISNQTILKAAHRHIQNLKRKEREYEHEMERLAREKIAHQQQLATLKKELAARWDHLDFSTILPDMAQLEQQRDKETKSTTTASEQPDIDDSGDMTMSGIATSIEQPYTLTNSPALSLSNSSSLTGVAGCTVESNTIELNVPRDPYPDLNQPLNLSTSPVECRGSPRRLPSPTHSPKRYSNGEWVGSQLSNSAILYPHRMDDDGWPKNKSNVKMNHQSPSAATIVRANFVAATTNQGWQGSTSIVRTLPNVNTNVVRSMPSPGNVVRSLPVSSTNSVRAIPTSISNTVRALSVPTCSVRSMASLSTVTTSISECHTQTVPIISTGGIQLPAQLVAGSVQLNNGASSLLGQSAIQVIPPEGYKLLPADHTANGTKPLTITLAHAGVTDGLDRGFGNEEGKQGPVMVTVNKNGLSALHLAVPTSARSIPHTQATGGGCPVSTVPLNLTVSGSGASMKMSQTGTSLLPSYLPLAHANGITQLVPGMSLVGPIVVSQPQRAAVVPGSVVSMGSGVPVPKGLKGSVGGAVPLVPHYANTLAAGGLNNLVNSVVVVSAPGGVGMMGGNATIVSSSSMGKP